MRRLILHPSHARERLLSSRPPTPHLGSLHTPAPQRQRPSSTLLICFPGLSSVKSIHCGMAALGRLLIL